MVQKIMEGEGQKIFRLQAQHPEGRRQQHELGNRAAQGGRHGFLGDMWGTTLKKINYKYTY